MERKGGERIEEEHHRDVVGLLAANSGRPCQFPGSVIVSHATSNPPSKSRRKYEPTRTKEKNRSNNSIDECTGVLLL